MWESRWNVFTFTLSEGRYIIAGAVIDLLVPLPCPAILEQSIYAFGDKIQLGGNQFWSHLTHDIPAHAVIHLRTFCQPSLASYKEQIVYCLKIDLKKSHIKSATYQICIQGSNWDFRFPSKIYMKTITSHYPFWSKLDHIFVQFKKRCQYLTIIFFQHSFLCRIKIYKIR